MTLPLPRDPDRSERDGTVHLFLCGDVMIGRGIDQILPHPSTPEIFERCVRDAREYVALAELASGPIPRPVSPEYIWGDALEELARAAPDARIINLETSVTTCSDRWMHKGINYRAHPDNIACLTAAKVDVCVLANNHVLDYMYEGLEETLDTLSAAGLKVAGAGRNATEARRPGTIALPNGGRVLVFGLGARSSGIPADCAASPDRPGVELLEDVSPATADRIIQRVDRLRRSGDIVLASMHWGSNWGHEVPGAHVEFAHRLIDGGVDLVHGHSSHHPRPIEVYRNKLVLYGCGDFINDYEGITGFEEFRKELVLMYLPVVDPHNGELCRLSMIPFRIRRMRLHRASPLDAAWLRHTIRGASSEFNTAVDLSADGTLMLC